MSELKREVLSPRAWEPGCVRHEDRSSPWVARAAITLLLLLILATGVAAIAVKLGELDAEQRSRIDRLYREVDRLERETHP